MKRALATALLVETLSGPALGADPAPPSTSSGETESSPELVPYRKDVVRGHVQIGASGVFSAPFGALSDLRRFEDVAGVGYGVLGDLSLGVNRHVMVGAFGQYGALSDTRGCARCESTTFAVGLQAEYHLAQGLRFDPWLSYGMGFRSAQITAAEQTAAYSGLEFMRLTFGANWMATPNFGLGPVLAFHGARMIQVPAEESPHGSAWTFNLGFRVLLDLPGKRP